MTEKKDEIQKACNIAVELWNERNIPWPVTITIKHYMGEGNLVVVDAVLSFCKYGSIQYLDGQFTVGKHNTSWDDPMEFVYGWLECIEESYHLIYE